MVVTPAFAEMSTKDFMANSDASGISRAYVMGAFSALEWVNTTSANAGQPKLFCAPPKMGMTYEQLIATTGAFVVAKGDLYLKYPFNLVMLLALEDTFPCK